MSLPIRLVAACAGVVGVFASNPTTAQTPTFDLIPPIPGNSSAGVFGLSADGRVGAGWSPGPAVSAAFTWTRAGGRYDFGLEPNVTQDTAGRAISGDGTTVVGDGGGGGAFRWRGPGTFQPLGLLPGYERGFARSVSGDGSIVVGNSETLSRAFGQAFRWTAAGMQPLGFTRPGSSFSNAYGISRDGSTIVGYSAGAIGNDAFVWTEARGMQILPQLPGTPDPRSLAQGVNFDGSIIVGESGRVSTAALWRNGEVFSLGMIPGYVSNARAVNDDGSVVVGYLASGSEHFAMIWTPGAGMERLSDYFAGYGVSVPPGLTITDCFAVSGDGRTFAGVAVGVGGGGFVATIPTPATLLLSTGLVLVAVRRRR